MRLHKKDFSSLDDERDHYIAEGVAHILERKPMPVDLMATLDELGVNLNWLFTEAASLMEVHDEIYPKED